MLTEVLFKESIDRVVIKDILNDFHESGPINSNHLETLSYLKMWKPDQFKLFEPRLMFLMGLFYKITEPQTFVEAIYNSFAQAIVENTGHRFTPVQADAYSSIQTHTNFSFSAPTSAGKSFLFQEIIREVKGDIIIVLPSRALISEYLIKIKNLVPPTTLVLQFVEIVNTKKSKNRIYIITPERGEEIFPNIENLNLDLILLDEAQIADEGIRGMIFDSLVRRLDKKLRDIKKVFTHPFIQNPDAHFKRHNIENNISSEVYSQKTVGKIYLEHFKGSFKYFSPFEQDLKKGDTETDIIRKTLSEDGTILIYISKANIYDGSFLKEFSEYIDLCPVLVDKEAIRYISRLEEFLGTKDDNDKNSILVNLIKRGIVIHHGSIPLKARLIIEEFVNCRHAKICFSTSTLIQGINMPFDIVWVNHFKFQGSEDMKALNLKNLIGRAGRTTLESNSFDYGFVVIERRNKKSFINRLKTESSLSTHSKLDDLEDANSGDFQDIVEAIRNDSFDNDLHLTAAQVERIIYSDINEDIKFILDNLLDENQLPLTVSQYYRLKPAQRKKVKKSFENIYKVHLRRQNLNPGESSVLSTSIPILLWMIQGKSFAEIVSLRYAFLSEKDQRRKLRRQLKLKEITKNEYEIALKSIKIRYSCIANSLPDINFRSGVPLFGRNISVTEIDFDKVIYDTYDYLDKVIALSMKDPMSAAFTLYYRQNGDIRANSLSNYIKYGTNDPTEVWLLKYGFSFEEIELLKEHVEKIDATEIVFKDSINVFIENSENKKLIERYL